MVAPPSPPRGVTWCRVMTCHVMTCHVMTWLMTWQGSNGDREMAAALHAAGLAPWDVAMADLVAGDISYVSHRLEPCVCFFRTAKCRTASTPSLLALAPPQTMRRFLSHRR